jgi:hypothetical protein
VAQGGLIAPLSRVFYKGQTNRHIMWEEIQDMPGEIFDIEEWCHPMAECWHDMELNETVTDTKDS